MAGGAPKGNCNNPNGRPRAGLAFLEQLRQALAVEGVVRQKSLMRHAVQRAYVDDTVLVALLKKLVPDLNESDVRMSGELAEAISEARERIRVKMAHEAGKLDEAIVGTTLTQGASLAIDGDIVECEHTDPPVGEISEVPPETGDVEPAVDLGTPSDNVEEEVVEPVPEAVEELIVP